MSLEAIRDEFLTTGRLSDSSLTELQDLLQGRDPYSAITLVGDAEERRLIPDVLACLRSSDAMVRWNAVGVLFTRLKDASGAEQCLDLAQRDPDQMVRTIATCGLGEILPRIQDHELAVSIASTLLELLVRSDEDRGVREAAYEGILAALEIPPAERPPASKHLDLEQDVRPEFIRRFREQYIEGCQSEEPAD